ncbi:anaerobic carbon-monoxide dehydrogenase catalytic subunit [Candidatus Aerophobetes bacterium]|uniref:Carbon monoxide dehydrogenase n=1 Tax=Aerophobetes bacterium TaxID=2030807 RepID=A0A523QHB6_UNCAE|nr:MAG: anaerobic carbon-monoxide dehydrogenase catalytic subunit [Candidatus Aerophobetes bacterium]
MAQDKRSIDQATQKVLQRAKEENINTAWDRFDLMQPQCGFGELGICCRICNMGPCRIDPFGDGPQTGVCGANADTIVARNLARMIAAGAAAHSDHGRDVAHALLLASQGKAKAYGIKDEEKLNALAIEYGIKRDGRKKEEIAEELAQKILNEFGQQHGEVRMALRAPKKRVELWRKLGILPRGVDREVVEIMHRTHMGVGNDYRNILMHGLRTALSDGWGGSMIATELSDVLFGSPRPIRGASNLGVLREDEVNVVVHGHEPTLSDVVVAASQDPELLELAKKKGAKGINLAGICCTSNEILMRHGIPVAGNFLQQELALLTGAVELMMVDVQCLMPAVADAAGCSHTKLVTTSPKCKFPQVTHIQFEEEKAYQIAKEILKLAVENFPNRNKNKVQIPREEENLVAGFTAESVFNFLGGKFRATYRPLNDAIIAGRLRGAAGVVGCNNPNICHDYGHIEMTKELIKNDVLVVATGCSAIASAKAGLLQPEAAMRLAGKGLQEICETVGIPPVLHVGSCVDNSRILITLTNVVNEGGLGEDISDLPVAGAAPEWMSEKAISIGFYFVASGVFTIFGTPQPVLGSQNVTRFMCEELEEIVGGKYAFEVDPVKAAHLMIDHINKKREALKLRPVMYEEAAKKEKELAKA